MSICSSMRPREYMSSAIACSGVSKALALLTSGLFCAETRLSSGASYSGEPTHDTSTVVSLSVTSVYSL